MCDVFLEFLKLIVNKRYCIFLWKLHIWITFDHTIQYYYVSCITTRSQSKYNWQVTFKAVKNSMCAMRDTYIWIQALLKRLIIRKDFDETIIYNSFRLLFFVTFSWFLFEMYKSCEILALISSRCLNTVFTYR